MMERREEVLAALAALNPLTFAREYLKFRPDEPQARAPDFHRIGLNCATVGKSTVAAVLAVQMMMTQPGVTVLVVGPSGRQSGETLQKVPGVSAGVGDETVARRWSERPVDDDAGPVTDCGIAGSGSDDSRVLGGVAVDHR